MHCVQDEGALKTHSLHADIIVNLSGSKHIAAALSTFGVTGDTKDLLVAKIDASGVPATECAEFVVFLELPEVRDLIQDPLLKHPVLEASSLLSICSMSAFHVHISCWFASILAQPCA